jgi:hypothetical protein
MGARRSVLPVGRPLAAGSVAHGAVFDLLAGVVMVVQLAFIVFVAVGAILAGAGTGSCRSTFLPSPGVLTSSSSATNARPRLSRSGFARRASGAVYEGGSTALWRR